MGSSNSRGNRNNHRGPQMHQQPPPGAYQPNNMQRQPPGTYPAQMQRQQMQRQYQPPPAPPREITSGDSLKVISCAAIKSNSVKFAQEKSSGKLSFSFIVNSTVPSTCQVHVAQHVGIRDGVILSPLVPNLSQNKPFDIPSGVDQSQTVVIRDITKYPSSVLKHNPKEPNNLPFIISLVYDCNDGKKQSYYCLLSRNVNGTGTMIKEILVVGGKAYQLEQVFGAVEVHHHAPGEETGVVSGEVDDDDDGAMCVVCLTEPKNTTILPCRHMCMCKGCAEIIKAQNPQQCPICRQSIQQLVTMS